MAGTAIDVAVAVVRNAAGQVLMAERTARQVAAGFWEAPGGKIEPGETPAQAAVRELLEETGLSAGSLSPFMTYDHAFPTKRVRLHMFQVSAWHGTPSGREGQRLAWVDPASPGVAPILPSNHRLLTALGLPPRLEFIDIARSSPALLAQVNAALSAGTRLLLLRGDGLAPDQRVAVARRVCQLATTAGARVLLAASVQEAARAGATGVHSRADALRCMSARPPMLLWSVSCHNADDVRRAEALGADLVLMQVAGPGFAGVTSLPIYAEGHAGQPGHAVRIGAASGLADVAAVPRAWMIAGGAPTGAGQHPH